MTKKELIRKNETFKSVIKGLLDIISSQNEEIAKNTKEIIQSRNNHW